jgi:hypothetical protein
MRLSAPAVRSADPERAQKAQHAGLAPLLPEPLAQPPQPLPALAPLLAGVRSHALGRRSPLSPNWLSTEYPGDLYEIFSLVS